MPRIRDLDTVAADGAQIVVNSAANEAGLVPTSEFVLAADFDTEIGAAVQDALDLKVTGPGSSTSGRPAVFNGTGGNALSEVTFSAFKTSLALVKGDVGLGNVPNTDTTTQANVAFTGLSAGAAVADADTFPTNQGASNLKQTFGAVKTWVKSWIVKGDVGLGNVDNTSDANKPVSTPTVARFQWAGIHPFDFIAAGRHANILAGTSTADVTDELQDFFDSLGANALMGDAKGRRAIMPAGLYNIEGQLSIAQIGCRIDGAGIGGTAIVLRADLAAGESALDFRQTLANYGNIGLSIRGISVNMAGYAGDAITLWKPYDGVTVEDVYVDNVADANYGVVIKPDPTNNPADPWSQGVYMRNVIAAHKHLTATATAPLWYLEAVNESTFEMCKAFATYAASGGVAPCHGFEAVDCNAVMFKNPAVALASEHGFYVRSTGNRICRSVIIDTPTIEGGSGVIKTGGVAGTDEDNMVLDCEVRSPRIVYPYTNHADGDFSLARTRRGVFDTKVFTINAHSDTQGNRYRSDTGPSAVTGGSLKDIIDMPPNLMPATKVEARLTSNQTIPVTAYTKVDFTTEDTDAAGEYNAATSTFTAARAGRYRIEVGLIFAGNSATGQTTARLAVSGVASKMLFVMPTPTVGTMHQSVVELDLAAGATVIVQAYSDPGMLITASANWSYLRITPVARDLIV